MTIFSKIRTPNWLFRILFYRNKVAGKIIFFDTNCYRGLARKFDQAALNKLMKKIKKREKCRRVDVRLSYLVASEMFAHLREPVSSNNYQECKLGLIAATNHIDMHESKILPGPDNEMYRFIYGRFHAKEQAAQLSLFQSLQWLTSYSFNNYYIGLNSAQFIQVEQHLQDLKDNWIDSMADNFIKKHDPSYTGGWQVFMNNVAKRNQLLKDINKAEANGDIFIQFAVGMWTYITKSFAMPWKLLYRELIDRLRRRFDVIFRLQLRIMKNLCMGGYNLNKRENDVIDFLIAVSIDPDADIIFVSNETANLVPNLHALGYQNQVITLNEYFEALRIKERI